MVLKHFCSSEQAFGARHPWVSSVSDEQQAPQAQRAVMAWRSRVLPYFREDRVCPRRRDTVPMGQCPPDLSAQLAMNGLLPNEATARDGNCGIDAFARSLMHQWELGCPPHLVKRRQSLQTTSDKVSFLR